MKKLPLMLLLLSGCSSHMDLQGYDPNDYYKDHPVEDRVEVRHLQHVAHFSSGDQLAPGEADAIAFQLKDITPAAVETMQINLPPAQAGNDNRRIRLSKLLHGLGYPNAKISFGTLNALERNQAEIEVAYAAVVTPDCPDWKMSPVTTYSNTAHNIGCATTTNLGLMVDDPHDLVRGNSGPRSHETARDTLVIDKYKTNASMGAATSSSSGSSSSSGTGQ